MGAEAQRGPLRLTPLRRHRFEGAGGAGCGDELAVLEEAGGVGVGTMWVWRCGSMKSRRRITES